MKQRFVCAAPAFAAGRESRPARRLRKGAASAILAEEAAAARAAARREAQRMTMYICGDSTAASYSPQQAPLTGWGQVLGEWIGNMPIENRAMAGRSTKSFLSEGRLQALEGALRPGDLLLIQFTHNDTSDLVWRHTDPWTSFKNNLEIFVDTARLAGAVPVLLTPICRRYWQEGELRPSHGEYPEVIRVVARQRNVPLIDVYEQSRALVQSLGEEQSRALYLHVEPNVYPAYPNGHTDDTHTRRPGAEAFSRIVADGLKALGLVKGGK